MSNIWMIFKIKSIMTIFETTILWIKIAPSYYGLMYALWFMIWYWLIKKRIYINGKNILKPNNEWKIWDFMDSLLFYIFFWVVIWGRLWYVIFYNFSNFIFCFWCKSIFLFFLLFRSMNQFIDKCRRKNSANSCFDNPVSKNET